MSTLTTHERSAHTPTFGSLLRAELLRIRSRRFAQWMIVVLVGLLLLIAGISIHAVHEANAAPGTAQDLVDAQYGVGIAIAIFVFLFGCTLGGADWSNRTMPALLFWEPRRLRLFATKLLALALAVVVLLTAASLVWLVFNLYLVNSHGSFDDSNGVTGDFLVAFGRCALVCMVAALFGFGIANLTRNTGAALGVAFVYFVIVDAAVAGLVPWLTRWMFTVNLGAFLTDGGADIDTGHDHVVHVSAAAGGIVMVLYVAVLCGVAAELFRRRDVT